MENKFSIVIVGGGIVGLAIAYELSSHGHKKICVIERNTSITGRNQSTRNGGVIHSGLYYPQDTEPLKAKLCVEGVPLLYEFCAQYGLPHKKTGKLVLASNAGEEEYLDFFHQVGIENGVEVTRITSIEAKNMEPNLGQVTMALHVPSTGSAALVPLLEKLKVLAEANGVTFLLGAKVTGITAHGAEVSVSMESTGSPQTIQTELLINAAGLYADDVAKMINPNVVYDLAPARGELSRFRPGQRMDTVHNGMHLYPAPFFYFNDTKEIAALPIAELRKLLKEGKVTKTLGAHVSPAFENVNGMYVMGKIATVGPVKSLHGGKEDYDVDLKKPEDYLQKVRHYFPNLQPEDIEPHYTGIMAVRRGFSDFTILKDDMFPQCINLIGMDSPAWTASLAIAKYVREKLL